MRILFLTPYLPYPATKGTSLRNLSIIRGAAREHTVHLLTFAGEHDRESVEVLRRELAGVETVAPPRRTALQRLALLPFPQPDLAWRLHSPQFQARLRETLDRCDFDLVQVEGLEMGRYGLQVCRRRSAGARPRVVYEAHNAEYALQRSAFRADARSPVRWVGAAYSLLQWRKLRRFERRVCLAADATVAVSDADAAALKALDANLRPHVVPNGVDTSYFQYCPKDRPDDAQPALVFTGTFDYRPNVDAAAWFCDHVLPLVRQHHPGVRLLLVGRDPSPAVTRLAGPAVTVTGVVEDVRPYLYNSEVFVAPLRMGSGTRLKLLEAMSCGLPVVSTATGVEGLDVMPGQEALVADDAAGFAGAVLDLLANPDKCRHLAESARRLAERRYDWKAILPELERVYAEVALP